jgi:hypothetical protein
VSRFIGSRRALLVPSIVRPFALDFVANTGMVTSFGFADPQNFTGKNLGPADPTRKIHVCVMVGDIDGAPTINGVTVDGVAGSLVTGSATSGGEGRTQIWTADLGGAGNNNTTGTISVDLSGPADRVVAIAVYRMVNAGATTPVAGVSNSSGDPSATLNLPASGWGAIGCMFNSANSGSVNPLASGNFTQENLDDGSSGKIVAAARAAPGLSSGNNTFTFDVSAPSGNSIASFAAWGP